MHAVAVQSFLLLNITVNHVTTIRGRELDAPSKRPMEKEQRIARSGTIIAAVRHAHADAVAFGSATCIAR
jgi:hypothetical protein